MYSKLILLAFAVLLPNNHAASCVQWTIEAYTVTPIQGPFNETLREYNILFSRGGAYAAVSLLTTRTLTLHQLAAFAPQEECSR